jgi:GNAT superfamily N-acetyltransferase
MSSNSCAPGSLPDNKMRVTFPSARELVDGGQLEDLTQAHWQEVARNKRVMVLDPCIDRYLQYDKDGNLFCVALWAGEKLAGYSINLIGPHLHYRGLRCANNDVIFVYPEYRAGRTGMRVINATTERAAALGAKLMLWHAKEGTPFAKVLPRIGYGVQDIIFSKEL